MLGYPRFRRRSRPPSLPAAFVLFLLPVLLLPVSAPAQPAGGESGAAREGTSAPAVIPVPPEDEFGRGTPRSSVKHFLEAARGGNYETAAEYLDLRGMPSRMKNLSGATLARQLKIILDRGLWIDLSQLSEDPRGHRNDGLPSGRDLLGQIEMGGKTYVLFLDRVPRKDRVRIWKVSSETVTRIPEMYALAGYGWFGDFLSGLVPEVDLFGTYLWQWLGMAILMAGVYLLLLPVTWLAVFFVNRERKRPQVTRFVRGPLRFFVWVMILSSMKDLLSPTVALRALMQASTLGVVAVAWCLSALFDLYVAYLRRRFQERGRSGALVLLRPLQTVVRILVIVGSVLVWLDNVGFKVTTLITGLGVGGIAIALATQAVLSDIIGAVILLVSQPVRVGDFCRFGDKLGIVEEIGLIATRVRTLDNTLVSVPNAEFSKMHLENFTKREMVWFHPKISLPYGTTKEQILEVVSGVERMLREHPEVHDDPIQIYFTEIGNYSFDIDVFAYVKTGDFGEYKRIAQDLNLAILDIVRAAGVRLAMPARKVLVEDGSGDGSRAARREGAPGGGP